MLRFFVPGCLAAVLLCGWLLCSGCGKPAGDSSEPTSSAAASEQPVAVDLPAKIGSAEAPLQVEQTAADSEKSESAEDAAPRRLPVPEGVSAMPEPNLVWVDPKLGFVMVDGYISLREGMLEMFACPAGTKEHESVVAVYSQAQIVHAALLAVGAEVGSPAQFDPEFKPPTGTEIAVEVHWLDEAGKWQAIDAQQWVLDIKTGQPLSSPWVFAGSGFWKDEETGEEYYMAESGDFICVSNFSSATLDIPIESSQVNEGLLFEANTAKIPSVGTPVRLVLKPKLGQPEIDRTEE
ncbi:MAG: hypothetical protein KDA57_19155 [Planctomycetales bacterium]|nr:hypothetical protein [Planctomycetales bacterium]